MTSRRERTTTRTTRYVTLLSVVLALALTAALVACGSDKPSDRTAPTATDTPVLRQRRPRPPAPSKRTGNPGCPLQRNGRWELE